MSRISPKLRVLAVAALPFIVAGCASPTKPGEVARNWSCKLREMQISPVFPPREDVHVGDVYWLSEIGKTDADGYCRQRDEFMPIPPHMAYLDLTNDLHTYYGTRPMFPRSTTVQGTVTISPTGVTVSPGTQTTDTAEVASGVFKTGAPTRSRIVGFPDFMSVHVSNFALGAIVPIDAVLAPIGVARQNVRNASISIPVAESYSVPAMLIARKLGPEQHNDSAAEKAARAQAKNTLCESVRFMAPATVMNAGRPGQLHVVNEVYYTRAIDVNITAETAFSLAANRDREDAVAGSTPMNVTTTGIVTESTTTGSVTQTITKVSEGMLKLLQSRNNVPGVSVSYEQGDLLSVKMRRIFDRPVAIGFRSVALNVDPVNCTITSVPGAAVGPAFTFN